MEAQLFTKSAPDGRSLLLAHELFRVTTLGGTEAIHLAMALFAEVYKRENPARVSLSDDTDFVGFQRFCDEAGIECKL